MPQRISHSLLDPYLTTPLKRHYARLHLPARLPPEAIVGLGHLAAIVSAVGWAFCTSHWWGGLVGAAGVIANHLCDIFDGTHARATGQCRHGGELLDHFADPLSFSYILTGIGVGMGRLDLALAGVIVLMATAVLTNIKAKLTGEFTLARFGPTEFKTLLALWGIATSVLATQWDAPSLAANVVHAYELLLAIGIVQLAVGLWTSVREVNRLAKPADHSEWVVTSDRQPESVPETVAQR